MMRKGSKLGSLIVLMSLCIWASEASALTIVTHYIGGAAPANASGGGDLNSIVDTAARLWESAYSDSTILDLYYGWGPAGDAGTHSLQMSDAAGREVSGVVLFDNSGSVPFFLDPTPAASEEYRRRTEEYQDLGGGYINVARLYGSPVGEASGRVDLLSVALHEIGHALGLSGSSILFLRQSSNGALRISEAYPYAGTEIPLARNNSGIVPHFEMNEIVYGSVMSGVNGDERRLPSELDILANAQVSGFTLGVRGTVSASHATPESRRQVPGSRTGVVDRVALDDGRN